MNHSFGSSASVSPQGKFIQRIFRLEEENKTLTEQVAGLLAWKNNVEEWLAENLGYSQNEQLSNFGIPSSGSEPNGDTHQGDGGDSVHSGESSATFPVSMVRSHENGISNASTGRPSRPAIMNREDSGSDTETVPGPSNSRTENGLVPVSMEILKVEVESPSSSGARDENARRRRSTDSTDSSTPPNDRPDVDAGNESQETTNTSVRVDERGSSDQSSVQSSISIQPIANVSIAKRASNVYVYETPSRPTTSTQSVEDDEESTPCNICQQVWPTEDDSMLFCDSCNVCVHQRCYGVKVVPQGEWRCNTCRKGIAPNLQPCRFCTTLGGAMIPVQSPAKTHWAHVSCTWWIPGPSINNPDKMDFVIGIPQIDKRRWKLSCFICKKGKGSTCCIQCAHRRCAKSYHVTCAFKHGLKMKMVEDDNVDQGIIFLSYCDTHRNVPDNDTFTLPPRKRRRMNAPPPLPPPPAAAS